MLRSCFVELQVLIMEKLASCQYSCLIITAFIGRLYLYDFWTRTCSSCNIRDMSRTKSRMMKYHSHDPTAPPPQSSIIFHISDTIKMLYKPYLSPLSYDSGYIGLEGPYQTGNTVIRPKCETHTVPSLALEIVNSFLFLRHLSTSLLCVLLVTFFTHYVQSRWQIRATPTHPMTISILIPSLDLMEDHTMRAEGPRLSITPLCLKPYSPNYT
jgi:hypothetical protein